MHICEECERGDCEFRGCGAVECKRQMPKEQDFKKKDYQHELIYKQDADEYSCSCGKWVMVGCEKEIVQSAYDNHTLYGRIEQLEAENESLKQTKNYWKICAEKAESEKATALERVQELNDTAIELEGRIGEQEKYIRELKAEGGE